jgi:hypothetical protein
MSEQSFVGSHSDRIVVQDECFPVLCSTWVNSASEPVVEQYFRWLVPLVERASREGVPLVNITDAGLASAPDAAVRRLIADRTRDLLPQNRGEVRSITVVESAAIRAVLSALSWLHGDMRSETVATRTAALERAAAMLRAADVAPPRDLLATLGPRPVAARPGRR